MTNTYELVSFHLCPYVQRAAIVLAEKGVPFQRVDIDLAAKPAWFSAISPLGKVPLLRTEEGVLFESAAIVEYLDDVATPRLHPENAFLRAQHRGWMEFGSTVLSEIAQLYSARDGKAFLERHAVLRSKFVQLEAQLETQAEAGPYFAGERFHVVDAVFAPVFRYWDVFDALYDFGTFDGLPRLRAWRAALSARPSVTGAVSADYRERLHRFLAAKDSYLGVLARTAQAAKQPADMQSASIN